jgi:hypothetical protein
MEAESTRENLAGLCEASWRLIPESSRNQFVSRLWLIDMDWTFTEWKLVARLCEHDEFTGTVTVGIV